MSDRKSINEQIARLERNSTVWLEPLKEWVETASNLVKIQKVSSLSVQKIALQKIFGSNLYLKNKKVSGMAQTHNETLAAALENLEKLPSNLLTARLYSIARNYFIKNS